MEVEMIKEQDEKDYFQYYKHITSWGGVISAIMILTIFWLVMPLEQYFEFSYV
jgi:hypothetical protein